ncbi:MAG: glycerol kinase GlpK [Deltaproteobacteria bacterium]|nr:glycerol kinase GlpK [Deltaproteobacteria bacterium]MBI3293784.1 glycerol kinase GlpK [Deltaproteobacteria bacterium]
MRQYILAIDQGTTGSTALILNGELEIVGTSSNDFPQHFPQPAWVEHDLNEVWQSVCLAAAGAIKEAGIDPGEIAGIGLTNQRETTCAWDLNGLPLARAIVWQDRRTASECVKLKGKRLEKFISHRTGLLIDPYFSATKMAWMKKYVPTVRDGLKTGTIRFGTIDSFLLYRLTGGRHATDVTNASRTMMMNLASCNWDDDLLDLFGIPRAVLPEILPTAVEYGRTRGFLNVPDGTPITGIAGDQHAALFGQACFGKGDAKCTYGTGAFALLNTGTEPIFSKNRMLTTVAWKLGSKTTYCLEGSAFIAGAAVQWVRDGLGIIESSPAIEPLAASVPDSDGVTFVPALSGMGAPHWLAEARGLITGITRRTSRAHIARATLEGVAFQVAELIAAMGKDFGKRISSLKVDGGAASNDLLMQFQSDILATKIVRSSIQETTAFGAGLQAGLGCGLWKDLDEISARWKNRGEFHPKISTARRRVELKRWNRAVCAVRLLSQ